MARAWVPGTRRASESLTVIDKSEVWERCRVVRRYIGTSERFPAPVEYLQGVLHRVGGVFVFGL